MATVNSRRGTLASGHRPGDSRPRTQPHNAPAERAGLPQAPPTSRRKLATPQKINAETADKILIEVRHRLVAAEAVTAVTCAALNGQGADADHDAVLARQRCVADELS